MFFFESVPPDKFRLRVGGAYLLTVKSFFNMVFTIAHEYGHALDPCELKNGNMHIPIYESIQQCFLKQGWVENRRDREECGRNDQTSEVFADWIAVQIVNLALKQFTQNYSQQSIYYAVINSVRDLCEEEETGDSLNLDTHPPPRVRIRKIFFGNPQIRKILSCKPLTSVENYCGIEFIKNGSL